MRKNDFLTIYYELIKKAEEVIASSDSSDLHRKYKIYRSYMKQITQVLNDITDKSELTAEIEIVKQKHNEVEERLLIEKEGIFKNIRTRICREHIRKKYYAKNQKSSLINKKS